MSVRTTVQAPESGRAESAPPRAGEAVNPIARLQRSAGNHAIQRAMSPGAPLPPELRASLESHFKAPLDRVRIHDDDASRAIANTLGARAFTVGQSIHLGEAVTGSARNELLAHEVVHTLQQGPLRPRAKLKVGTPNDAFERQADRLSASFVHGGLPEPVSHVGAPVIQRAMHPAHYGEWEDFVYGFTTDWATGDTIGIEMYMKFHPNANVRADLIGLTQTTMNTINGRVDARELSGLHQATSGPGAGRWIDRAPGIPNPMYAASQRIRPGGNAARLGDYETEPITALSPADQATMPREGRHYDGWGQHGYRKVVSGAFVTRPAELYDDPFFDRVVPNSEQVFETAALALEGPQEGTYYGSVEWGWRTDAAGRMTHIPFRVISQGVPTANFLTAATIWNASRVDFEYETTAAAAMHSLQTTAAGTRMVPMTPAVTIPVATRVASTGNGGTIGTRSFVEVTHGTVTGFVEAANLRGVAVGAETMDLPVPLVHTVSNPAGTTMLRAAGVTLPPNTLTLPVGTRVVTTRCMVPTPTLTNHYEGTVADGPRTGTRGYFYVPDLTLERLGTR